MDAKYSKSTGGIYPTAVYKEFPADALAIPDDLYEKFKKGELASFDVVAGAVVEFSCAPTLDELKQTKISEITGAFPTKPPVISPFDLA